MFEYEKKIPLSFEEYSFLSRNPERSTHTVIQNNFYYDTDKYEMNKRGITCRIREKNGKYKATIKEHDFADANCSKETSKEVLNEFDNSLFNGLDVHLHGKLTTERTVLYSDKYCKVVLDKNTYLNFTDYELEVEYLPNYAERADCLLKSFAEELRIRQKNYGTSELLERIKLSKTKSARFFERKITLGI